ncbi:MAG: hypothetical protein IPF70_16680 [Saprospiraceae bacterium]|nr:hypothetical protein [Saprospiraceae bacterium]
MTGTSSCPNDTSIATINISPQANAGADGSTAICDNSTTAINLFSLITGEQTGGAWTRLTGTGGTFTGSTFTPAAGATSSTFRYIVTGTSPCPNDTSIATINISPQANAGADGSTTVCANTTSINLFSLITGEQTGGTWSKVSGTGGTFSAGAGTFIPTSATTSVFRYVVNGTSPCPNDTSLATVNVTPTFTLGDFVWYDQNNNGIQDGGEPGLGSITVKLYDDADNNNIPDAAAIQTTTTSGTGAYSFANLCQGRYIVSIVTPSGYIQSTTTATSAEPNNATANDNNGIAIYNTTELRSNDINLTTDNPRVDFGLIGTGSIGDLVFKDNDGNGLQGGVGETGISGVIVTDLYNQWKQFHRKRHDRCQWYLHLQ